MSDVVEEEVTAMPRIKSGASISLAFHAINIKHKVGTFGTDLKNIKKAEGK